MEMSMSKKKSVGDFKIGQKGDERSKTLGTLQKRPSLSESALNFSVMHSVPPPYNSGKGIKIALFSQRHQHLNTQTSTFEHKTSTSEH